MSGKDQFATINKDIDMSISKIKPVICGKTIFFVEGDNKQIHSLYYSEEKGGYQVSSITSYAEHLFSSGIKQIVAVNSPFNMLFAVLNNGSFASFTYSQDLKIMGWSQHWLGGDAKVLEACVITGKLSDRVYFRTRREGKVTGVSSREYIECFDCQYLTANSSASIPYDVLYADCHMHDLSDMQKEIDTDFSKLIEAGSAFDFKGDLSEIEELVDKQINIELGFNITKEEIGNVFMLGSSLVKDLVDENEIEGQESISDVWQNFLYIYFTDYRKTILLSLGLWLALLRKINEYNVKALKILLKDYSDVSRLDDIIENIINIYAKFCKQQELIENWSNIDKRILASPYKVHHLSISKYEFFPKIIERILAVEYAGNFNGLIGKLKLSKVIIESINSTPSAYSRHKKQALLKEFTFNTDLNWLKLNLDASIENLDLIELAVKIANNADNQDRQLDAFYHEANLFNARNSILDIFHENIFRDFAIKFRLNELLVENRYNLDNLNNFFQIQVIRIISIIYDKYNFNEKQNIIIKQDITEFLSGFLSICKDVPTIIRDQLDLNDLISNLINGYMNNDPEILQQVMETRIAIRAKLIALSYADDVNNSALINSQPVDLQFTLVLLNDAKQYELVLSLNGLDQVRDEEDDEDIEINDILEEYKYLSDRAKIAIEEKVKCYNKQDYDENAFKELDEIITYPVIGDIKDFIYNGLANYIVELNDGVINVSEELLDQYQDHANQLKTNLPALDDMPELLLIAYTQIQISAENINNNYLTLIRYANLVMPTENMEFASVWQDRVNPSKVDKFLFLSKECFPIFKQNFPDIDAKMLKMLIRSMSASAKELSNKEMYPVYCGMDVSFIGDDELLKTRIIKKESGEYAHKIRENFADSYRFISMGFVYKSVLQTFPLIFPEEIEHIMKKDTEIGIKLFNTKGGYIEEKTAGYIKTKQFINAPKINYDIINYYLPDKKYLMGDSIGSIKTPYISGWLYFNCNQPINKDVDLTYVVDRPYPATILKIDVKAKIFPHYLN